MKLPVPKARHVRRFVLLVLALCVPVCSLADSGTPLMWTGLYHLVFGNLLIGIGEGALGARLFKLPSWRCVSTMVLANYASFLAGFAPVILLRNYLDAAAIPLLALRPFTVFAVAVTFLLTLIVEWPFCWLAAKESHGKRWQVATRFDLIVNVCSYLFIIVPFYSSASFVGVQSQARIQSNLLFVNGNKAWVYYLVPSEKEVWRIHLDGTGAAKYVSVPYPDNDQRLFIEEGQTSGALSLCIGHGDGPRFTSSTLIQNFSNVTATTRSKARFSGIADAPISTGNWMNFGLATDLRPPANRNLEVRAGFWAGEGITVAPPGTYEEKDITRYSLETPFAQWPARSPSVLPGNIIVWQLGPQIVVLDASSRKLAFLVRGSSPVVTLF